MYSMFKLVDWSSVVKLGCTLSAHCAGEESELRKEFIKLGLCPVNNLSMGGREATKEGRWVVGERVAMVERMLKEGEYLDIDGYEQDDDSFLRELVAYAENRVDTIMFKSRTSGTTITVVPSRSKGMWLAHIEGSKPSHYAALWAAMQ